MDRFQFLESLAWLYTDAPLSQLDQEANSKAIRTTGNVTKGSDNGADSAKQQASKTWPPLCSQIILKDCFCCFETQNKFGNNVMCYFSSEDSSFDSTAMGFEMALALRKVYSGNGDENLKNSENRDNHYVDPYLMEEGDEELLHSLRSDYTLIENQTAEQKEANKKNQIPARSDTTTIGALYFLISGKSYVVDHTLIEHIYCPKDLTNLPEGQTENAIPCLRFQFSNTIIRIWASMSLKRPVAVTKLLDTVSAIGKRLDRNLWLPSRYTKELSQTSIDEYDTTFASFRLQEKVFKLRTSLSLLSSLIETLVNPPQNISASLLMHSMFGGNSDLRGWNPEEVSLLLNKISESVATASLSRQQADDLLEKISTLENTLLCKLENTHDCSSNSIHHSSLVLEATNIKKCVKELKHVQSILISCCLIREY